jgi:hypothetical protein
MRYRHFSEIVAIMLTSQGDLRIKNEPDMVHMPVIPALGRLRQRQKDCEFEANLD